MAPIFPALLMSIFSATRTFDIDIAMTIFFMWLVAGYISLLFIATPLFWLLQKSTELRLSNIILTSILATLLFTLLLALLPGHRVPWYSAMINLSMFTLPSGVVGGIAFWILRERPITTGCTGSPLRGSSVS